jgi:hypothetical protein
VKFGVVQGILIPPIVHDWQPDFGGNGINTGKK